MRVRYLGLAVGVAALVTSSCGDPLEEASAIEALPRALTAAEEAVIDRSNGFGLRLLSEVVAGDPRPNVVLSPLSASMALGMTLNGAAGGTFDAMRETLGFEGLSEPEINEAYSSLIELLTTLDPHVRFDIANALWANQLFSFHGQFLDDVSDAFGARIETADFMDPGTADAVNGWVRDNTEGKIEKIVDQLDPDLAALLLNAIYFDGNWTTQFDPADTRPGAFTRPDGSSGTVDMMEIQRGEFRMGGGDGYGAVELPYGGEAFSMVLMVPWDGDARGLAASMDEARWSELKTSLSSPARELDRLAIPKLRLSYDVFLNDALSAMGMDIAFTPAADFSDMSPEGDRFCIDYVRQKTFLEMDEVGTRAAAVTAVGVRATSFSEFVADRPFLLVLRERLSDTILFTGLIEDPTAEEEDPAPQRSRCQ